MGDINWKAVLFRILSGLGVTVLEAIRGFLQGMEMGEFGQWAVIAGALTSILVWAVGKGIAALEPKTP
jgi:hypothetical protein